jgi:hypothetical protein
MVQFPDKLELSPQNHFDASDNKIYSISQHNDSAIITVWDMWSMIPLKEIPLNTRYSENNKNVFFEPYADSLIIYISKSEDIDYPRFTKSNISKKELELNYTKSISSARLFVLQKNNFTVCKPNNSKDGSKGYQDITGLSTFFLLYYSWQGKAYNLIVHNGNYINKYEDGEFQRYEKYSEIEIELLSGNYEERKEYGFKKELAIFEFNTIAASISKNGSKLALLDADYKTLRFYNILNNNELKFVKQLSTTVPDSNKFTIAFTGVDNSKFIIANLKKSEIIDLNTGSVNTIKHIFTKKDSVLIKEKIKKYNRIGYSTFIVNTINNRSVELRFGDSEPGYFYKYLSFVIDTKENELEYISIDQKNSKSNIDDIIIQTTMDSKLLKVYDLNLGKVIKTLNLNHKIEDQYIVFDKNNYKTIVVNDGNNNFNKILNVFPFIQTVYKNNSIIGIGNVVRESTNTNTNAAYYLEQYYQGDTEQKTLYYLDRQGYLKTGTNFSADEMRMIFGIDHLSSYNSDIEVSVTNSIAKSSKGDFVFIGSSKTSRWQDTNTFKTAEEFIETVTEKRNRFKDQVVISKYTDSCSILIDSFPGFKYGQFSTIENQLLLSSPKKIALYDFVNKEFISSTNIEDTIVLISDISDDGSYVSYLTTDSKVWKFDFNTGKNRELFSINSPLEKDNRVVFGINEAYSFDNNSNQIKFSPNAEFLMLANEDSVYVYSIESQKIYRKFKLNFKPNSVARYHNINLSNTGIPIYRTRKRKSQYVYYPIIQFRTLPDADVAFSLMNVGGHWLVTLPNNYYFGEPEAIKGVSFLAKGKVFPYSQYDHYYNRPDKVMQVVSDYYGVENDEAINMLNLIHKKRLKKLGIGIHESLPSGLPTLQIINKNSIKQTANNISINIDAKSQNSKIHEVIIEINDVPILKDKINPNNSLHKSYNIQLAKGYNVVRIYCKDNNGISSLPEYLSLYGVGNETKPNLYLITIGESQFKQANYNLTYAAKDAHDVATLFTKSKVYGKVVTKTLTNEQVTKENIAALRSFLDQAGINDEVMIFIAGHGVLDENLDYFFASYDMDFNNPNQRGIAYEDLEGLLDGIKPLKKVLLIDACHSGEIDKEEVELLATNEVQEGEIQFRAVGNSVKPKLGMQNTSELTKALFTDLRKGTGATVISSAGGGEYAMESGEWKNGLFTYCMLKGIETKAADFNSDGEIWLKELQEYVQTQVSELSGGKQQPTSRIENSVLDYRIW